MPFESAGAAATSASVSPQLAAATSDDLSATASISDSSQQPAVAADAAAEIAAAAETPTDDSHAPKPFVGKRKQNFERIPVGRIDVPNVRAELPPELQAEMDEALGDMSLDDLVAADSPLPLPVADNIEPETKVKAKVVSVHRDNVFFEIGARNQGMVPLKNFAEPPAPGTVMEVVVARFNALDGLYELGLMSAAVDVADWSQVHDGMIVEARVTGHNKGGLECEVNKLRGFIPASQVSMYRVEDLSSLVGQKFACVVTEANPERRNLVLSRRGVLEREQAEAKEKLWGELAIGQVREGTVRSLRDFGAFVDIGGVDGMLHVSQLSWDRIKHPSDVLEVGQKIKVKIQKIDPESHKISLAFRDLAENPWDTVSSKYQVGMGVQGKVSRIMDFGAFVKLEPGIEGMVHISELAWSRVFRVGDILSEGQTIEAKVTSVDRENQRIGLSIKALIAKPVPVQKEKSAEPEPEEVAEPLPPPKARKTPLKGGLGGSGGAAFGLKF